MADISSFPDRFIERMKTLLPTEHDAFFARCTERIPRTFRWEADGTPPQTLATTPVAGLPNVYRLDEHLPLGRTMDHWAGRMYIQSLSSMLPVFAIDAEELEEAKVLDMCSAPGSKSTLLSRHIGPDGFVVCNELSASRSKKLVANLMRMGSANALVTQHDGTKLPRRWGQEFDVVLLDAPCSSEGYARRSRDYLQSEWSERYIFQSAKLQRDLIEAAWKLLRPGGVLLYSTCTTAPEENELVVQHLKSRFEGVVLEPLPIDPCIPLQPAIAEWDGQTIEADIQAHAKRLYPHKTTDTWDSECFFLCRIRKTKGVKMAPPEKVLPPNPPVLCKKNARAEVITKVCKTYGIERSVFKPYEVMKREDSFWLTSAAAVKFAQKNRHKRAGLPIMDKNRNMSTPFAMHFGQNATTQVFDATKEQAETWLQGLDIRLEEPLEYTPGTQLIVRYEGQGIGITKVLTGQKKLKNRLERALVESVTLG